MKKNQYKHLIKMLNTYYGIYFFKSQQNSIYIYNINYGILIFYTWPLMHKV